MSQQVTLAEVAQWAGVSPATASRVLHGSGARRVRSELRARVLSAAAELNYSANANAQAIARGTTTTVGLVIHDMADGFATAVASGVMAAAAERGLIVTVGSSGCDPLTEIRHVEALRNQRARALVLAGTRFTDPDVTALLAAELRSFVVGGGGIAVIGKAGLPANTLLLDNIGGAQRLAGTLAALGYRRFAVITGPEQLCTAEERLRGYRAGLADSGIPLPGENVVGAPFTRDGGYAAMAELLDRELDAEIVLAVNDVMAVGAMVALRERGVRVPADLAVAGFDGIPMLRDIRPALTTVRLPLSAIGRQALALALLPVATDEPGRPTELLIAGDVVVRDSTPGPPGNPTPPHASGC